MSLDTLQLFILQFSIIVYFWEISVQIIDVNRAQKGFILYMYIGTRRAHSEQLL